MYAQGLGVPASNQTAIKWLRKGSDRGSASAKFGLGFMYLYGHGLQLSYRTALKYLTAATEKARAPPAPIRGLQNPPRSWQL